MKHIISVMVENKFGVLSRVAGLFSGRGFNIETISSGPTLDPEVSQITIVTTTGDDRILEQIIKQLNKLIDIIKVTDLVENDYVEREMCLVKVNAPTEHRAEALRIGDIFRAQVIDSSQKSYTFQVTGDAKKIDAFIELLRPIGIKELVRTGKVAITRE